MSTSSDETTCESTSSAGVPCVRAAGHEGHHFSVGERVLWARGTRQSRPVTSTTPCPRCSRPLHTDSAIGVCFGPDEDTEEEMMMGGQFDCLLSERDALRARLAETEARLAEAREDVGRLERRIGFLRGAMRAVGHDYERPSHVMGCGACDGLARTEARDA